MAGLLDDSEVARQFCHLIPLQRLRPVTLRPAFSGGLPFSSFDYILRQKITKVKKIFINKISPIHI
jgi:hypothetical protein